ncbi:MAG: TetR/AcrR family transcriptional regulator [Eubacteriales bacterium]
MSEYKEEAIYLAAKELFRELGYKKTTMSKISKQAGISNGLISYYYKKQDFIERLFKKYIENINEAIIRDVGHLLENTFQKFVLNSMISNYIMNTVSPESKKLRDELYENDAMPDSLHHEYRNLLRTSLEEFEVRVSDEEFFLYNEVTYISKLKIDSDIYSDKIYLNKNTVFNFFSGLVLKLAGVQEDIIQYNINKGNSLFDKVDISGISLFSD